MKIEIGIPKDYKQRRLESWCELSAYWSEHIESDSFHTNTLEMICEKVLEYTDSNSKNSLADLGCGSGYFLNKIRQKRQWDKLVGLDFCPRMLQRARHINTFGEPKVLLNELDIEESKQYIASHLIESFNVVTASFVIDEIENINAFFCFVAEILGTGGYFICATLDYEREKERYKDQLASIHNESTILMSKELFNVSNYELFRIFRSLKLIKETANNYGLKLIDEKKFSPSEMKSREDGPGLLIQIWEK